MADKKEALAKILPGDILLYRVPAGENIGKYISWGEWDGGRGDYKYVHAGLVLSPALDKGFEQNPPATHYTTLSGEDWSRIDVWRIKPGIIMNPVKLDDWCKADLNVKYPYGKYFRFLGASLLARIGLQTLAQKLDAGGTHSDKSWAVCSATVCMALTAATGNDKLWPKLDENMRPCDIPLGQVVRVL